jgi:hypothetical protein
MFDSMEKHRCLPGLWLLLGKFKVAQTQRRKLSVMRWFYRTDYFISIGVSIYR